MKWLKTLQDLWQQRTLLYWFTRRDFVVRYRHTLVGVGWGFAQPVLTLGILTFVFGNVAGLSAGNVPYVLFVGVATLPWQLFSNALKLIGGSVRNNAPLITNIFFPRILLPLAAVLLSLADFVFAAVVFTVVAAVYGWAPDVHVLILPFFLALTVLFSLGMGLWLAALNVRYRDVSHLTPYLIQFGLFISPVGFRSSLVPEKYMVWYALNPLVGIIDGFRWALLADHPSFSLVNLFIGVGVIGLLLVSGWWFFTKEEPKFADII